MPGSVTWSPSVLPLIRLVTAAVLLGQFHEQFLQRTPHRMHGQHLASCQPYLLDHGTLAQRRHGDLDESVLLGAFEHQSVDPAGCDHEALLGLQQIALRAYARDAPLHYDGQSIADVFEFGEQMRTEKNGLARLPR